MLNLVTFQLMLIWHILVSWRNVPLIQEKKKNASKLHNYKEMASNIELNMTFMFTKNWKRNLL